MSITYCPKCIHKTRYKLVRETFGGMLSLNGSFRPDMGSDLYVHGRTPTAHATWCGCVDGSHMRQCFLGLGCRRPVRAPTNYGHAKRAGEQCAHRPCAYKNDVCHHSWTMSTVLRQIAGLFTLNETWPWWYAVSSTSWPMVAPTMVPLL